MGFPDSGVGEYHTINFARRNPDVIVPSIASITKCIIKGSDEVLAIYNPTVMTSAYKLPIPLEIGNEMGF